jgi:hypothetical protein
MVDWDLVNNSTINWDAAQTISNIILVFVMIIITAYYARQTARQVKLTEMSLSYQITGAADMREFLDDYENFIENKTRAKRWWQFWKG